ncbi:hypothetical protein ACIPDS_01535 [Kluyvera sp. NPDC087067]|uniref:hypothetical protein n=1 Tax=unclassified Kluyvera TaxID=2619995 RepID=UPI003814012C
MQTLSRLPLYLTSLLVLNSGYTLAAPDGIIHFRGQIVESPCDYNQPSQQRIRVSCYENQRHTEQTIPLNALLEGRTIVNERSSAQLHWINREQNLAILQVEYK